ncbi:MAG: hypothetical protein WBH98_07975 [Bacteroidales bacterium]
MMLLVFYKHQKKYFRIRFVFMNFVHLLGGLYVTTMLKEQTNNQGYD